MMGHIDFYRQLTCVSFANSYRPIYLKGLSPTPLPPSIPTRTGGWLRNLCKGVRPLHRQARNCENQQESPLIVETFTWGSVWGVPSLSPRSASVCCPHPFTWDLRRHSFYTFGVRTPRAAAPASGASPDISWRGGTNCLSQSPDGPSSHPSFSPNLLTPGPGIAPGLCRERQPLLPWWSGVIILFCCDPLSIHFLSSMNLLKCLGRGWCFLVLKAPTSFHCFPTSFPISLGSTRLWAYKWEEDRHGPFSLGVYDLE